MLIFQASPKFRPLAYQIRTTYYKSRIGTRDVVGHGCNGMYVYKDDAHFPFPAIRFQENCGEINALRLKEIGDWRLLCCEEKKQLYRISFCQTFAEFQHPTGHWKFVVGAAFFLVGCGVFCQIFTKFYVNDPLPSHLDYENQKHQLRRMIDIRVNPIDGLSSYWNYKTDNWIWVKEEKKLLFS